MAYWRLEPEVAGQIDANTVMDVSEHPPTVRRLHYQFDGWLGDDLVASFPCFLVTLRLKEDLQRARCTGCEFDRVEVTKSSLYRDLHLDRDIPEFRWMKVTGIAARDDVGLEAGSPELIVSDTVMNVLVKFNLHNCLITEYSR